MMLHERITVFEEHKDDRQKLYGYTYKEVSAYRKEYERLKEADSQALACTKANLINAFSNFYKSLRGERKGKVGFPKYKKKKTHNSYTSSFINNNMAVDFELKRIKLPKLGS